MTYVPIKEVLNIVRHWINVSSYGQLYKVILWIFESLNPVDMRSPLLSHANSLCSPPHPADLSSGRTWLPGPSPIFPGPLSLQPPSPLCCPSNRSPIIHIWAFVPAVPSASDLPRPSAYCKHILSHSLSHVWLFATPWTTACQASLSFTISQSLLTLLSVESVMPSNHLILCHPLLLLPLIFPSIRIFSNESVLCIRWPKYWSFCFSISPSNEYLGLISFKMDWFDLLAVQGTVKSLLQHHNSKASMLFLDFLKLKTKPKPFFR